MSGLTEQQILGLPCAACGQTMLQRQTAPYVYTISHDGRPPVQITIPDLEVIQCANPTCPGHESGESMILDSAATARITLETYRQLGLLTPAEIRAGRERLGMTQSQLQDLLRIGGNSLSRWEKGRVYQARSMDTLLRLAFQVPEVVEYLRHRHEAVALQIVSVPERFSHLNQAGIVLRSNRLRQPSTFWSQAA